MAAPSVKACVRLGRGIFGKCWGISFRHPSLQAVSWYSTSSDSHCDSDETGEFDSAARDQIFRAALTFVPQHGWSQKTLVCGAEAAGYPPLAHGMFSDGPADFIHFFYRDCNAQLAERLGQEAQKLTEKGEKLNTKQFVRDAVEIRLRLLIPYIDKWPEAMAIQTLPQNAVKSWSNLSDLVDEIWYQAGDQSTDFNWYTKRLSLAAVYKSTEITMIQDKSDDFVDTWCFLDRRVDNLVTVGKSIRNMQQGNVQMSDGLRGAVIMAKNVLGMNSRVR